MGISKELEPSIANAVEALGKAMSTLGIEALDQSPIIKAIMTPTSEPIPGMNESRGFTK